jgi:hypothetical protein
VGSWQAVSPVRADREVALAALLTCAFLGCGCFSAIAQPSEIRTTHNSETDVTMDWLTGNELGCAGVLEAGHVRLTPVRVMDSRRNATYQLWVVGAGEVGRSARTPRLVIGKDGFSVETGDHSSQELLITADGKQYGYRSNEHVSFLTERGSVGEAVVYSVSFADLEEIQAAYKVAVRIEASKRVLERCFDESNFDNLRMFLRTCPPR